jgi:hypothetical protein
MLALPPIDGKISSAQLLIDGTKSEFTQNADGVILKVPPPKADEVDRVVVLTVARAN